MAPAAPPTEDLRVGDHDQVVEGKPPGQRLGDGVHAPRGGRIVETLHEAGSHPVAGEHLDHPVRLPAGDDDAPALGRPLAQPHGKGRRLAGERLHGAERELHHRSPRRPVERGQGHRPVRVE